MKSSAAKERRVRHTKLNWERKRKILSKEQILNKYIHQLIIIKERRKREGASKRRINAVQDKIDEFIKMRDRARKGYYI